MVLNREEKEKMVLDFYNNKGYTYKQLTRELRMSPNQIREIIKRHEEKNDAIANKRKMLSLSSQAYKLFSEGKIMCKWQ
jgi:Mor family transcriptional regulator